MAIEKTTFTMTEISNSAASTEILAWLQANASEYFTSITSTESNNDNINGVACKIGDLTAIALYPSSTNTGYTTALRLGSGLSLRHNGTQKFPCAYKTSKGVVLFDNAHKPIFITKDKNTNNTIALACLNMVTYNYAYVAADFINGEELLRINSGSSSYYELRTKATIPAGATAMCPIIFGATGSYNEGLFLAKFNQNVNATECIIGIGEKQYIFDGAIALEE